MLALGFLYFAIKPLPDIWKDKDDMGREIEFRKIYAYIAIACGLISGFLIGAVTDYYTSNAYGPVKELA